LDAGIEDILKIHLNKLDLDLKLREKESESKIPDFRPYNNKDSIPSK